VHRQHYVYALWLLLVVALAFLEKLWVITHALYPTPAHIHDVLFGFSGYVHSLLEHGVYRSCDYLPFIPISNGTCVYTTRMPALPALLVGLSYIVGTNMAAVATAKAAIMSALLGFVMFVWARNARVTFAAVLVTAISLLGPQVVKHAAVIDYEEGLLVELMACHAILLGVLLVRPGPWAIRETAIACVGLVVLAGLGYLAKTTILPFLIMTMVFCAVQLRSRPSLAAAVVALGLLPLIAWSFFSLQTTGRWSLSSSWNGENLLRGFNSESYEIYPDISVDRIFNAKEGVLLDGRIVPMGHWTNRPPFTDEWQWNDYYAKLATQWVVSNPIKAVLFSGKKAWAMFVDVQRVPRKISAGEEAEPYGALTQLSGIGWMMIARVLFVAFCIGSIVEARATRSARALWPLVMVGAYSVPYVIVFASQKHAVPMLVYAGLSFAGTLSRLREHAGVANPQSVEATAAA
jgi:hypothetical protein